MPELADALIRHGPAYLEKYGDRLLPSHRRALADIVACRTEALGGQVFRCRRCGREHFAYRSCGNRSCPKCHTASIRRWLEKRQSELLPAPYFHLVLTIPHSLNPILRQHQQALYSLLIKAAGSAIVDLAKDQLHFIPAVMCVLHTWDRAMDYHAHVHCLISAGGLSLDRTTWQPGRQDFLLPGKALAKLFKGRFLDWMKKELPGVAIPRKAARCKWNLRIQPAVQGNKKVLEYLGRYIHRIAITNSRIVAFDDQTVTFRYKRVNEDQWRTMRLPAEQFISRFLQHVLPKGTHKVRYYGLWSSGYRKVREQLQQETGSPVDPDETTHVLCKGSLADSMKETIENEHPTHCCPFCRSKDIVFVRMVERKGRPPPFDFAYRH